MGPIDEEIDTHCAFAMSTPVNITSLLHMLKVPGKLTKNYWNFKMCEAKSERITTRDSNSRKDVGVNKLIYLGIKLLANSINSINSHNTQCLHKFYKLLVYALVAVINLLLSFSLCFEGCLCPFKIVHHRQQAFNDFPPYIAAMDSQFHSAHFL